MKQRNCNLPATLGFAELVYKALCHIPKGKVLTYGQLATWLNIASPRLIGKILSKNTHFITVPCHRVVGHNGHLTGFALGLIKKQELLEAEGIQVINQRIDLLKYGWSPPVLPSVEGD